MAQCSGFRNTSAGTADIHLLQGLPITVTGGITPMMSGRRASKPGSRHPPGRQRCLFRIIGNVIISHETMRKYVPPSLSGMMESSRLLKKYFLERTPLELEKHHVMEDQNGNLSELERTKGEQDISEALEGISW